MRATGATAQGKNALEDLPPFIGSGDEGDGSDEGDESDGPRGKCLGGNSPPFLGSGDGSDEGDGNDSLRGKWLGGTVPRS